MFTKKMFLLSLVSIIVINLNAQSVGGTTTGAATFCDSTNSGFIALNGHTGTILHWQYSINNGAIWNNLSNSTSTQSYNHLSKTTNYRAIVKNGSFPQDTSTVSTIKVNVPGIKGVISGGGNFCNGSGNGIINLTGITGNVLKWEFSTTGGSIWSTISNTTTSLTHLNIAQNTLYRAIVQSFTTCPNDTSATASFKIDQNTIAGIILSGDSVCYGTIGDTLKLTGNNGAILNWQTSLNNGVNWTSAGNSTNKLIYPTVTQTIWYKAIVKNGACNTETTTPVVIAVYTINSANAGNDITITQYENVSLYGSGNGAPNWTPIVSLNDPHAFNPIATPFNTTTYVLSLTDSHSCISKDSVIINVIIPVPTAFTPNNDGVNDFFVVDKIEQYEHNSLQIFNRWGNIVYKEAPYKNTWNGKSLNGQDLPDDLYYYILDYGNREKPTTNYVLIKR